MLSLRRVVLYQQSNIDAPGLKEFFCSQDPVFLYSLFDDSMNVYYAYQMPGLIDRFSSIIIGEGVKVDGTISITKYSHLRFLKIGSNSCRGTTSLKIEDCPILRSIRIGDNCFQPGSKRRKTTEEEVCSITKCEKLLCIDFGCNSFCEYDDLILEDLKSIRSVTIGKGTFENVYCINTERRK